MWDKIRKHIIDGLEELKELSLGEISHISFLRCLLFEWFRNNDYLVIPNYNPPIPSKRPVDILVLKNKAPFMAIAISPVVDLEKVQALTRAPVDKKIIVTYLKKYDKVKESKFFLKPGIEHIHIWD